MQIDNCISSGTTRVDDQQPSTSRDRVGFGPLPGRSMRQTLEVHEFNQSRLTPEEKAEKLIKEAEAAKARMYDTPDKPTDMHISKQFHSVMVDEDYLLVASHVDSTTLSKIMTGDYVDFSKLIPRDRILHDDDQRLEVGSQRGAYLLGPG